MMVEHRWVVTITLNGGIEKTHVVSEASYEYILDALYNKVDFCVTDNNTSYHYFASHVACIATTMRVSGI